MGMAHDAKFAVLWLYTSFSVIPVLMSIRKHREDCIHQTSFFKTETLDNKRMKDSEIVSWYNMCCKSIKLSSTGRARHLYPSKMGDCNRWVENQKHQFTLNLEFSHSALERKCHTQKGVLGFQLSNTFIIKFIQLAIMQAFAAIWEIQF